MSRTHSLKDKDNRKVVPLQGNSNEGTSARTRPFSFEEIMLRRQNKKLAVDAKDAEQMSLPDRFSTMDKSSHPDFDGGPTFRRDSIPVKMAKEENLKVTPRKKEEDRSRKEVHTLKDKASLDLGIDLRLKSKKSTSSRDRGEVTERQSHSRNRTNEHLRSDFENTFERRKSKVVASHDRYNERDKSSQRLGKRKHMNENGNTSKSDLDVSSSKKKDFKRHQEAEYSERKERKKESSWSFYKEALPKKRRSRSHEHVQERDEKRLSISPRAQKGEPYHSTRSGRHHFDADKDKISSNGRHFSGNYRRKSGHSSRLGGYSPRKRRTEAAIKTPSPTNRSPERKSAAWDLPPSGKISNTTDSSQAGQQQSGQAVSLDSRGLSVSASVTLHSQSGQPSLSNLLVNKIVSVDSIQLTQATRPMRRLYVENIPLSASDKSLMECLNEFLLSSGGTHIEGTKPCISCIINKEKGQAVVEFLTPEDATSALAFDGKSFSDSILKVRRPKDFVEAATGNPERSVLAIPSVSDIVKDSPHKVFIGGISKSISSDLLKEIVSAFGVLKAYHFIFDEDLNEHFAFLEYADQSITLKACAGLNGMKLGGTVLTVAQVDPFPSRQETAERPPFYGIPEHVKPLLEKPTQVLKLKNVFNREEFLVLTEPELEEMLEDVRLECSRFGTVKSVDLVKYSHRNLVVHQDSYVVNDMSTWSPVVQSENGSEALENLDCSNCVEKEDDENLSQNVRDSECVEEDFHLHVVQSKDEFEQNEITRVNQQETGARPQETTLPDSSGGQPGFSKDAEAKIEGSDPQPEPTDADLQKIASTNTISGTVDVVTEQKLDEANMFEEGCILVEYAREEAACIAAHALNGRLYGDRLVSAGYAPYNLYQTRFAR
ncbi:hypothetical protein H6P81_013011 [Aristolochia fimbriata]|uniref:RRM domain-containing protein n=1 Tax=Aristolochia fimbriata TaxID=158543 RepID=A0AAV7EI41_ARIFI|nr:hypothetical protein H6P81_013011 [Aristolochia fimbriata]